MPQSGIKAGEVVETGHTCLVAMTLAMRLRVVASVPDDRWTAAAGAAHALRPAMLAHQREALGIIHQARKVNQVRCSHDGASSSREPVRCSRSCHHIRYAPAAPPGPPPRNPTRATFDYDRPHLWWRNTEQTRVPRERLCRPNHDPCRIRVPDVHQPVRLAWDE